MVWHSNLVLVRDCIAFHAKDTYNLMKHLN